MQASRTVYDYDAQGRLARVDLGGDGSYDLSYAYDAEANLIGRTSGAGTRCLTPRNSYAEIA